jgi:phage terminase Nu1 subunit (DNA packaging protein)
MAQIINKTELARRLGVSAPRISQLIGRGLPVRPDGKIDLASALKWTGANVDRSNSAGSKIQPTPVVSAVRSSTPSADPGRSVPQADPARALLIGRARIAFARAKREERAERLAAGELLERQDVLEFIASTFTMVRDALLSQPDRMAATVAAVNDTAETHRLLKADVNALLTRLSKAIATSQFNG